MPEDQVEPDAQPETALAVPTEVTLEKKEKKRGRGRPRKIPIKPKDAETAQLLKNKEKHLGKDPLINALRGGSVGLDVLDVAMMQLAVESSSLDFERGEAERKGEDTTAISAKKINAIKAFIDTYFRKRDSLVSESFDFKSKRFKLLFEFWANKWRSACLKSGMSQEQIQNLFQHAGDEFEDWEDEATRFLKSSI